MDKRAFRVMEIIDHEREGLASTYEEAMVLMELSETPFSPSTHSFWDPMTSRRR